MATVNFTAFYPYIRPEVPECPSPIIEAYTRNVCKEFCEKTLAWKYTCAAVNVVADQNDYLLTSVLPSNTIIALPVWIKFNGTYIEPAGESQVQDVSPYQAVNDTSYTYDMRDVNTIHLNWDPSTAITGGLIARVALAPDDSSTSVDDVLFIRWREVIAAGVKGRLMLMKNKLWSDKEMGKYYDSLYRGQMGGAKMTVKAGYTSSPTQVKMRPVA